MSPRNNKPLKDTTTDFFLKIVEKEKAQSTKESTSKDVVNEKKVKAIDTGARFYNYMNQILDKILSSKVSIMILSFMMAAILFYSVSGKDILTSPTSGATLENVPVNVENLDDSLEASGIPDSVSVVLVGPSLDIYKTNFSIVNLSFMECIQLVRHMSNVEHVVLNGFTNGQSLKLGEERLSVIERLPSEIVKK